jgi:hypothetical protein
MLNGTIAGALSALVFALIHDIFISDIWFSLPALLVAGALCGFCLGWTYGLLFERSSWGSWLKFNALFVGMFVVLGAVSLLVFEPVTSIPALMALDGPPDELIRQAMPITVVSTLLIAGIIGRLYARAWTHYAAILFTCTVLVLLLGLNVSVIGLVAFTNSTLYLIAELAGLIVALNLVFVVGFMGLERLSLLEPQTRF